MYRKGKLRSTHDAEADGVDEEVSGAEVCAVVLCLHAMVADGETSQVEAGSKRFGAARQSTKARDRPR
ncbi:hypothetical protein GOP47_0027223 [Adiantum capillus-veneris]|nr:hypothetical protein GOP47_0027223 [Adiantum capillus-veneris]